jgi:hypothetical protein
MRSGGAARNQIRKHPDEYSLSSIEMEMCLEPLKRKTLSSFFLLPVRRQNCHRSRIMRITADTK